MNILDSSIVLFTLGQECNGGMPTDAASVARYAAALIPTRMSRTIFGFKSIVYHGDTTVFITKSKKYGYLLETFSKRSSSGSATLLPRNEDAKEEPLKDMQEGDLLRYLFGNLEAVLIIRRGMTNDAS